jgi:hypothetical protein
VEVLQLVYHCISRSQHRDAFLMIGMMVAANALDHPIDMPKNPPLVVGITDVGNC